jgi:hypothetical protein
LEKQLKKFYHSTAFEFSNQAKAWVLDRYKDKFKEPLGHNTDLTQYLPQAQQEWINSVVAVELKEFLKQYGCGIDYFGINAFVCNLGNPDPHIDTKGDLEGNVYRIKSRFNVMILGNPNDSLTWWGHFDYDHKDIVETKFLAPNGREYTNKSIPGNSTQERWDYLGEPSLVARDVYTPSAFVKTDCAHTVDFTPGPRLVVTVALDKSIEEILDNARVS